MMENVLIPGMITIRLPLMDVCYYSWLKQSITHAETMVEFDTDYPLMDFTMEIIKFPFTFPIMCFCKIFASRYISIISIYQISE